jgi:hypothetical protein
MRFATTALAASTGADVEVHGRITDSTIGVSAGDSFVDASNVDWGHPSGPSPAGSGTPVQGDAVFFSPWVGYVPPPRPPVSSGPPPSVEDCKSILFIGVRGSGENPQSDPPIYSDDTDGFGSRSFDAFYGFQQRLSIVEPTRTIKPFGLRYRALGVTHNPINFGTDAYFESIYEGVDSLISVLYDQRTKCPGQRAVLAGYSQGALVIHLALRQLAESDPSMLTSSRIAAIVLIADPAKINGGSETIWERDNTEAEPGSGVFMAEGVWTKTFGMDDDLGGPLPSAVTGRSISVCFDRDIVCAPGSQSLFNGVHTSYPSSALNAAGEWAADRVDALYP